MGGVWTILAVAMLGLAGHGMARDGFRQPSGWPRALAAALLAWTWATLGLQVLGTLGWLDRLALLIWAFAGWAFAVVLRRVRPLREEAFAKPIEPFDVPAMLAIVLALWVVTILGVPSLLLPPKVVSDGPIYHLYFAAKWWKAGRLFLVASPFGENAAPYFPANGDLIFSGMMTLYGGDRLAREGQLPFLLLSAATVFALTRKLGASASSSAIATVWVVTCMPLLLFSMEANVDTVFMAGYLLSAYFGLLYAKDRAGIASLVLSGLAAGAAWGTKATASAFIPPLLALVGLGVLASRGRWPVRIAHLLVLGSSSLVLSGFWFARNAWLTGNPLYPLHVTLFGRTILRGWYASDVMKRSQFYLPMNDIEALVSTITAVFDPRLLPLWVLGGIGAWTWGRRKAPMGGWVWLCAGMAVANVAIYWLVIPYRTQQRFMLQGLALAAVPLARLLDRGRVLRWLASALILVHLVTPYSWPWGHLDDPAHPPRVPVPMAMISVPYSAESWKLLRTMPGAMGFQIAQEAVLAVALLAAVSWGLARRRPSVRRWSLAALLTFAVPGGYGLFLNSSIDRPGGASGLIYPNFADYAAGWRKLEGISPADGARIAYAGTNLPYFLMAGRLRNEVFYVNVDAHPDWLLHDYHLSAAERGDPTLWDTPRPGWDRMHPDYPAWLDNLRRKKIQLLVVAPANPYDGVLNIYDSELFPIERYWAETHGEDFERIYPRERPDPKFWIYRVKSRPG